MVETLTRIYKNSYDQTTGTYNELILSKAVLKGWITEVEKTQIITEVAGTTI